MCEVVVKFAWSFWSNSSDGMAKWGANMTECSTEMELYIILATLENFECWNLTLLIMKCHHLK